VYTFLVENRLFYVYGYIAIQNFNVVHSLVIILHHMTFENFQSRAEYIPGRVNSRYYYELHKHSH